MPLRRRLIVLTAVLGFGWLAGCGGSKTPPTSPSGPVIASTFVGTWKNADANTRDIPQLDIRVADGAIYVHAYGTCLPTFCDWGEASTAAADAATGGFSVNWSFPEGIADKLTLTLSSADGPLETTLFVHYADGRPDRTAQESFRRAS